MTFLLITWYNLFTYYEVNFKTKEIAFEPPFKNYQSACLIIVLFTSNNTFVWILMKLIGINVYFLGSSPKNVFNKSSSMSTKNNTVKYNCSSTISNNTTTTTKSYTVNEWKHQNSCRYPAVIFTCTWTFYFKIMLLSFILQICTY